MPRYQVDEVDYKLAQTALDAGLTVGLICPRAEDPSYNSDPRLSLHAVCVEKAMAIKMADDPAYIIVDLNDLEQSE